MAKNSVNEQMELFENGGLRDQGKTKDPISKNPVPIGSTQKEVRDDIPANLSEGEFVLPADVVRYHGLEKIMGFRDQAKKGLQKMENMGQMGNSDEAILPDGTPFKQMAVGGNIPGQAVGIQQPQILQPTVQQQQQPVQGVNVNPAQNPAMRQSIYAQPRQPIFQPPNYIGGPAPIVGLPSRSPGYKQPTDTAKTPPKYDDIIGAPFGQLPKSETRVYKNPETDEVLYIPFINGEPLYPIPNGYVYQEVADKEKEKEEEAVKSTSVRKPTDSSDDGSSQEPNTAEYKVASTLMRDKAKDSALGKALSGIGSAIQKISPVGMFLEKSGMLQNKPVEKFGGLFPSDVSEATGMYANNKDRDLLNTYAKESGYVSYSNMVNTLGVVPSFKLGTKPGDVSMQTGKTYNYAGQSTGEDGSVAYSSAKDFANAMAASAATGWYGGTMTEKEIEDAIKDAKAKGQNWDRTKIDAYNKEMEDKYGKKTTDPKVDDTKPTTPIDSIVGDDPVDDSTEDESIVGDDPYDGGNDSPGDDSPGGGKIVCTTMNKMYGLPMYSNKVWMRYNKYKNLDSAWELGYHKIFLSLVKKMPTNKYIRGILEWLAKNRTHGVKEEMKGNIFTTNTLLIRPILGPVVYITGKLIQKGILKKVNVKDI